MDVKCVQCGAVILQSGRGRKRKYCSERCHLRVVSIRYHEANPKTNLTAPNVGAISEFRVVTELLLKGYDVFRAVSPASPFDLVAFKDGHIYRVEVTTGHYKGTEGRFTYSQHDPNKFDIMAVVLLDKIVYLPEGSPIS